MATNGNRKSKGDEMIPLGDTRPVRGPEPQDHLPPMKDRTVTWEYEGAEYTTPADFFDDFEVLEALEDGRLVTVMRDLLGPDQLARLKDQIKAENDGKVPLSAFEDVFAALGKAGPTPGR